jgi:UDP-N-acetylmuramoyl-L-alanyl-D-glutamate--2,6-diaminopimelate ligase
MTLAELVAAAKTLAPDAAATVERLGVGGRRVSTVVHDSRSAASGGVFVAVKGHRADGTVFVEQAAARGAVAVIAEKAAPPGLTVPWLQTPDARVSLAELSSIFYGRPSEFLSLIGVTGTNGKTTSTYLLAAVLDAAGMPCGRVGTVSFKVGQEERDASHTTPEASELQKLLREMVDRGNHACAMEVSSHALALQRVAYLTFRAALFTNLTRDHLDFHGDMQQYFEAKRKLFEMLPKGAPSIVNIDDPRGVELAESLKDVITYGIDRPADIRPVDVVSTLEGLTFGVETPRGRVNVKSSLVGRPNVYNILGTVGVAIALDLPTTAIEEGLARLDRVPGRFQMVSGPADDVRVVVDYAHTDDALKNLLETARPLTARKIITVFGCGGDRDTTKRPLMGAVAARLSDLVVITSDNPRSENPERIIEEIKRGVAPQRDPSAPERTGTAYIAITDRRAAIDHAVKVAKPGDLVLIAGKGHEKYQVIGDRTLPFDDVEIARVALQRRSAAKV